MIVYLLEMLPHPTQPVNVSPPAVYFEQRYSMKRLFSNTNQVTAHSTVYNSLLSQNIQISINLRRGQV